MAKREVRPPQNPFADRMAANNAQDATLALLGVDSTETLKSVFRDAQIDEHGVVTLGNYQLTSVGLVDHGATLDEWETMGRYFRALTTSLNWLIGDWMASGERVHGQTYDDAAELVGRTVKTLYNWAYVCSHVQISRRREISTTGLLFSHHAVVAALHPDDQDYWLERAAEHGLSVKKLEALMHQYPQGLPDGFQPNQTPHRLKDPADKLQEEFATFKARIAKIERKAGKTSKKLLAQWLREEADRIERGEG